MTEYYEDLAEGETDRYGPYTVTAEEIVEFGRKYDPQPHHLSEESALELGYDGLIASAFHSLAIAKRLSVDGRWRDVATIGGLGFDNVRVEAPVYAGEALYLEETIVSKRRSSSDPTRGIVTREKRLLGENGDCRMSWESINLVESRGDA